MTEYFINRQTKVFQANLFGGITKTGNCFSTHSLDTYCFSFEIGWSFATAFTECKTGSFVFLEHQINFTRKPDLGRHALKETDQFPCELQVISLAFSFPIYYTNSSFIISSAEDFTFSKLSIYSSAYCLFEIVSA